MRQGGFSINSVIITDVRRDDGGGPIAVGKLIAAARFERGISLASLNGNVGTGELFIYTAAAPAGDDGGFVLRRPSLVSSGAAFVCQEHDK